jgi:hypothetical protein
MSFNRATRNYQVKILNQNCPRVHIKRATYDNAPNLFKSEGMLGVIYMSDHVENLQGVHCIDGFFIVHVCSTFSFGFRIFGAIHYRVGVHFFYPLHLELANKA